MTTPAKRTALVTGATSGIGYHLAKELALQGFKVYAVGRRVEKMEPLKEFGVIAIKADITNPESTLLIRDRISEENEGTLDLLVQNAGGGYAAATIDLNMEDVKWNYETNLFAPMRISKEFAPLVIRAKGTIAFSGSVFNFCPAPLLSTYCSSKAALKQYTNCLELELKPFGVKVVHITIGAVNTEFSGVIASKEPPKGGYFNFDDQGYQINIELEKYVYTNKSRVATPQSVAKNLAKDLSAPNPPYSVRRGSYAYLLAFINFLLPRAWLQKLLWKKYHWLELVEKVKKSGKLDKTN